MSQAAWGWLATAQQAPRLSGGRERLLYWGNGIVRLRSPCLRGGDPPPLAPVLTPSLGAPGLPFRCPSLPAWGWGTREGRHLPLPQPGADLWALWRGQCLLRGRNQGAGRPAAGRWALPLLSPPLSFPPLSSPPLPAPPLPAWETSHSQFTQKGNRDSGTEERS